MKFESYLALRYFKGTRKGAKFLSFIKTMAIAGVAIGSAGLLISLSIVHGFKSTINDKILGFAPHITVTSFGDQPLYRTDTLLTYLNQFEEIQAKQIVTQGEVMIQTRNGVTGTILKGVENDEVSNLSEYITTGEFDLSKDESGYPGIILGENISSTLNAALGSIITIYTISEGVGMANSPEIQQFRLTGIYETGIDIFDGLFAITHLEETLDLFQLEGTQAHGVEIKLTPGTDIDQFDRMLDDRLMVPYFTESINHRYANIFEWVNMQESLIPLVISVMIIVAAFNLIGAVLMMVLERTRDIGILKTIGGKSSVIRRVFLFEGLIVATIGLVIGIGISLLFAFIQLEYQLIRLSEENYYMSYAPVEPHLFDFVLTAVVTIGICALASWFPARVAAKTDPLKVIAYGR